MFDATSALRVGLAASLLLVTVPSTPAHAAAQKGPEARLLERALKLLPEAPTVPVRLIVRFAEGVASIARKLV